MNASKLVAPIKNRMNLRIAIRIFASSFARQRAIITVAQILSRPPSSDREKVV
jgi:hypothetical protein